jgi:LysM repeat protein
MTVPNIVSGLTTKSPVVTPTVTPVIKTDPNIVTPKNFKPVVTAPIVKPVVTPASTGSYSVVGGDTLGAIASRNGMSVQQIMALNPTITDPNKIGVGQSINLGKPAVTETQTQTNPDGTPKTVITPPVTQTPEQKIAQDNTDIATKAGQAGLSVTEYQNLMNSKNSVTKEETDAIAKELGITALEGVAFKKPSQSSQQMYQGAYDTAGLSDLKTRISSLLDEVAKQRSQLADATGAIDENPFLTEASRVGRGKRLLDQAETKINNTLAQVDSLQKLYDGGVTEINNMVSRNQTDFGNNQAIDQAQLNYLQKKAEVQASQLTASRTNATTGTYLDSVATNKKPDLVGNDNTGYFRYDGTLKKFVQVIAPSAKAGLDMEQTRLQNEKIKVDIANVSAGGAFKPTADQTALANKATFANMVDTDGTPIVFTPEDRAKLQSDPNFFYWVLQKASENGIY